MAASNPTTGDTTGAGTQITFTTSNETWTVDAGVLVASTGSDAAHSDFGGSTLLNYGTIVSATLSSVDLFGPNATVFNAAFGSIIGYQVGLDMDESGQNITNKGTIIGQIVNGVEFDSLLIILI